MSSSSSVSLSPSLKALAKSGSTPVAFSSHVLEQVEAEVKQAADEVRSKGLSGECFIVVLTGLLFTLYQPGHLGAVHRIGCRLELATAHSNDLQRRCYVAELMRETGLKCIAFVGVPKVINCLGNLYATLDDDIKRQLDSDGRRTMTSENMKLATTRGRELWDDIYQPHSEKLLEKLGRSHPDLGTFILQAVYSTLLAPTAEASRKPSDLDRVLTSVLAIACLRAQPGLGPELVSHVYGLRKAQGGEWVTSNEGAEWLLGEVDRLVSIMRGEGGERPSSG